MRPSDTDSLPALPGEAEGWHVREKTAEGYPLMGSSPAERAEGEEREARLKAQAMRDHPFEGDGEHCQAKIWFRPRGSVSTGRISGWSGCGWSRDMHPEAT